jgi:hypothetical protein
VRGRMRPTYHDDGGFHFVYTARSQDGKTGSVAYVNSGARQRRWIRRSRAGPTARHRGLHFCERVLHIGTL